MLSYFNFGIFFLLKFESFFFFKYRLKNQNIYKYNKILLFTCDRSQQTTICISRRAICVYRETHIVV